MLINANNISLKTNANIQTIEYTGAGMYNTDNVISFTFDFVPKVIILSGDDGGNNIPVVAGYGCDRTISNIGNNNWQFWKWNGRTVTITGKHYWNGAYNDELNASFNIPGKSYTITAIG